MIRNFKDGPASPLFTPLPFKSNNLLPLSGLNGNGIGERMLKAAEYALQGECVCRGIPFSVRDILVLSNQPASVELDPVKAEWLVFLHTSDLRPPVYTKDGFISPMRGQGNLWEHAADYIILYEDNIRERIKILRRRHIGTFQRIWGENCFEAVAHQKPYPVFAPDQSAADWGGNQTRVVQPDGGFPDTCWMNWLYAWKNPHPQKAITNIRFEPISGIVVVSAISAGSVSELPLRWQKRQKACISLPAGQSFKFGLDDHGLLEQVQLDLGQIISAKPRLLYPEETWPQTYNNQLPEKSGTEIVIEYTAHPDACFHFYDEGKAFTVINQKTIRDQQDGKYRQSKTTNGKSIKMQLIASAIRRVELRAIEKESGMSVPVKLHIHGEWGEYLPPLDRHRIPDNNWFEDYSVDFMHWGDHACTYIPGHTTIDLPLGKVYIEISKGFEIRPVRKIAEIKPSTKEIVIEIEKVLSWREEGWVTADTQVHFLSPISALLEGAAEGVNVVNPLASQWGELMTNVGDFDGKTTWGSKENGGDGEYLVRVGSENRQHVLGHISLLGYRGNIIVPMTTGGPRESALGDPVEILLTEWAMRCKKQGGVVVLPHFPNPRAEHAATIVTGDVDAIEMTSWGYLYYGISPYSLSDWYRYLNCGYLIPAVGGTDKMSSRYCPGYCPYICTS